MERDKLQDIDMNKQSQTRDKSKKDGRKKQKPTETQGDI